LSPAVLTLAGLSEAKIVLAPDANERRATALSAARAITSVSDAFDAETAADALRTVSDLAKQVEAARAVVKAPVLELGKKIDSTAKDFSADLEAEKVRLSRLLGEFQAVERAKAEEVQRAAAAEARRLAEEAARAAADVEFATNGAEADRAQQVAAQAETAAIEARVAVAAAAPVKPRGVAVREVWKFEVTDLAALYKARPDLCVIEANSPLIRETVKVNQTIPGLRIWKEAAASTR
jgi:hypothetical protein